MFKLLPLILALCTLGAAFPEVQLLVPIASSSQHTQPAPNVLSEANSVSTEASTSESSSELPMEPSASETETNAAAPPSRASFVLTSSRAVPLPAIHHHVLPAETLPLPITISTRPGVRTVIAPETITIHQPTVARIGEVVQKIPTAVSHQSQTIVHNHARVVTPIVVPAVRTITTQVVRAYHTPLIFAPQAPVLRVLQN